MELAEMMELLDSGGVLALAALILWRADKRLGALESKLSELVTAVKGVNGP